MDILVLAEDYPPNQGGIAEYSFNLCSELHSRGHGIRLVSAHVTGDAEFDATAGYPVMRIGERDVRRKPLGLVARARAVARFRKELGAWLDEVLRDRRPDFALVTCVSEWAHELRRLGVPYVVCVHGGDAFGARTDWLRSRYRRLTVRRILSGASLICANSEYTAEMIGADAALKARTIATYCGVAPDFLAAVESRGVCGQIPQHDATVRVLTICRLVPIKAVDVVIRVLATLAPRHPGLRLTIAGDGPERGALEALARTLGVQDRVEFAGYVSNVADKAELFARTAILAHSGRSDARTGRAEAFGIVFAEAGACCRPVVGPRIGGVGEVIEDGVTGLLVEPDDAASLANALDRLLRHPDLARQIGANGRVRVERHFTYGLIAEKLTERVGEALRRS